jgi:polysaccharide biosynthesis/export protein
VLVFCAALLGSCATSLNSDTSRSFSQASTTGVNPPGSNAPDTAEMLLTQRSGGTPVRVAQNGDAAPLALSDGAYRIGPSDVLQIVVFKVPELSQTVQVADTGTVNLPLVGEIPAAGKTPHDLERELTTRLGAQYLKNPQVTVYVKEFNSQKVTITGDVKKPGVYPLTGKTTLLQVVAIAGGFEDTTNWTVLVLRHTDGKRAAAKFDVNQIQEGRTEDPTLQAGDVLVAGSSAIKKGYGAILKALPIAGLFAFL